MDCVTQSIAAGIGRRAVANNKSPVWRETCLINALPDTYPRTIPVHLAHRYNSRSKRDILMHLLDIEGGGDTIARIILP